jgi:predicted NACHT family NTPase
VTKWDNPDDAFLNIAQGIRKAAEKLIKERQERLQNNSLTGLESLQGYAKKYRERHAQIKLLRMPQAIDLETIYTKVRFLDDCNPFLSLEKLEQYHREQNQRRFQTRDRAEMDGFTAANENPCLMVLGAPGAGKSTFLRRIGIEALKMGIDAAQFAHDCIPVFLELKGFKSEAVDIKQAIVTELGMLGAPVPEAGVTKALEEGKFLVLLDGLDEVPKANLDAVMAAIQSFVCEYDQNRFIASCRIASYRSSSSFQSFRDIELAEFDDEQMQQFISNWFRSELDVANQTAEKCWTLLNSENYKAAKELAHTPLLLTFLCLVYDRTQGFPSKPAELYRRSLDILLEEWAAEKRIQQEAVYEGLSIELEKVMLAEIAYQGFLADQLFFSRQDLVGQIKAFLADTVDKPKYLDGKAVLDAIAIQQGVLVERAEAVYSFSHLTIQEYLTAKYIISNAHLVEALVAQHLTEQRWREVFLLVAGLMPLNADLLLALMEAEAMKLIDTSRLEGLLGWADDVTEGSAGELKPTAKRAGAIVLVLDLVPALDLDLDLALAPTLALTLARDRTRARDRARSLARALTRDRVCARALVQKLDLARARAREFQKINFFNSLDFRTLIERLQALKIGIPGREEPYAVRQAFRDRIFHLWRDTLQLNPDFLELTAAEITTLDNYFYANELIVRCKEAAVRVTESVWTGIEERMLKVAGTTPTSNPQS